MGYGGGSFGGDFGATGVFAGDYREIGGSARCRSRRARLATSGVLAVAGAAGVALLLALVPPARAVCDGAASVNRGEQRTCTPPAPQDVALVLAGADTDTAGVAAYRYATADLPPAANRTTQRQHRDTVAPESYVYHDFALAAHGTVAFRYALDSRADVYLMDAAQFGAFCARHARDALWAARDTTAAAGTHTAAGAGVLYLVVDNTRTRGTVGVDEHVTVTTRVLSVSRATARKSCAAACTFRAVRPDETVVVEYTGTRDSVGASLRRGTPRHSTQTIAVAVVGAAVAAVACVVFVATIVSRRGPRRSPVWNTYI